LAHGVLLLAAEDNMNRRSGVLVVIAFFVAGVCSAQQFTRNSISFLTSDLGYSSSGVNQGHWSGGFGLAFDHHFSPRFSTELSIADERRNSGPAFVLTPTGRVAESPHEITTLPIDLVAAYHFISETRWRPYIGIGQRVITAERLTMFEPEIAGGVTFMLSPRFGIRADAKQLVAYRSRSWDSAFKAGFGVSFGF
jgi:hypothetical protein